MSGECDKCGEHCTECSCHPRYRYTCPHCLRTFIDKKYSEEYFCWECGEGLDVCPQKGYMYGLEGDIDIEISERIMSEGSEIYNKYKKYPFELLHAFGWILDVVKKKALKVDEI